MSTARSPVAPPPRRAAELFDGRPLTLPEMTAEHQVIFDNAIVGICYTRNRIVLRCNRRFEEMFGFGVGELANESIERLYPTHADYEFTGRLGYSHLKIHQTYNDERRMRRRDGELFWCQVSGQTLEPGQPENACIWIFQDISERKAAEEALTRANERLEQRVQERTADLRRAYEALTEQMRIREQTEEALVASNEKYRALFETFPIGISITDDQGEVIEINKSQSRISTLASMAKFTRDLELNKPSATLIHPDGRPMQQEDLPSSRALREQRVVADVELGVRYASSSRVRWFSVTAAPIPVKGYGAVVAYTETTQRKKLEEKDRVHQTELARVSRLNTMGEMAGALAHELGQPLAATLNYLHGCQLRLQAGEFAPELFESALSQAIYHAEQAGSIVRHVRCFVRKHEPESEPTDLNQLIGQMLGLLDFDRRELGVRLQLQLASENPVVLVDPLEIQQVMINLMKNGLEAMSDTPPEQRLLEIESRLRPNGRVEVTVSDRGPGVAKKNLTQIFNAFYTTKRNGIGLGLAVCRSIIESHEGKLAVNRNVHGGASFRFDLATVPPA
ncbi:MAG: hypothetical protein NVS9B10_08520 [Nevskia sp.]